MKHSGFLRITVLLLCAIFLSHLSSSQSVPHHISDRGIYTFLDEFASMHIIDVSTTVKPYTREQIADWLQEAEKQRQKLSDVQQSRLNYWLQEFSIESGKINRGCLGIANNEQMSFHLLPPEIIFKDTLLSTLIRPIYGFRYFSAGDDSFWGTYGGAEAITYMGENWSAWMSLRDNYQSGQKMAQPTWLTQEPGGNYKKQTGGGSGGEYSEMRAGITYSWKWGHFGLIKDHLCWGDNQNGSNILSGRTPSYPMVKLYLNPARWVEFSYHHGWLVSQAVDSAASIFPPSGQKRTVQRKKFIAANMFTVKPFQRLHFSFGNSIIYGDMDVHPVYLIPFAFYKSFVHTVHKGTSYQNNSLFVNISSRQIKHLHLYATYFVDEFSIRRVTDPERHNFTSFKGGISVTDWPIRNIFAGVEFTKTNPITFLHDEPTTSFQSNLYNLGHYLTDNADEIFLTARWYPVQTLQLGISYTHARKGNYYEYVRGMRNPRIDELAVLKDIIWENKSVQFQLMYYPFPNFRIFAGYTFSNLQGKDADGKTAEEYLEMFSARYLHGKKKIAEIGFGLGF